MACGPRYSVPKDLAQKLWLRALPRPNAVCTGPARAASHPIALWLWALGCGATPMKRKRRCRPQPAHCQTIRQQQATSQMRRSNRSKETWVAARAALLSYTVPPHSTLAKSAWQHLAWTFGNLLMPHRAASHHSRCCWTQHLVCMRSTLCCVADRPHQLPENTVQQTVR